MKRLIIGKYFAKTSTENSSYCKMKKKKKKEKRKKATINLWHAGRVGRRGAQQNKDVSSMVKVDKGGKVALETNGLTITHSAV